MQSLPSISVPGAKPARGLWQARSATQAHAAKRGNSTGEYCSACLGAAERLAANGSWKCARARLAPTLVVPGLGAGNRSDRKAIKLWPSWAAAAAPSASRTSCFASRVHRGDEDDGESQEGIYKYKLVVAYDGSAYAGWQLQLSQGKAVKPTVQLRLEEAICRVTQAERRQLRMSAAGRTDAGVHAQGQVACFSANRLVKDMGKLRESLNSLLPKDIRVYEAARVPPDFNARYLSTRKIYKYTIDARRVADPHMRDFALHIPWELDFNAMVEAAKIFEGTHDFTQFSNKPSGGRDGINPMKTINNLGISRDASGVITIIVDGSGFLYKMVRHLTGALIAVGSGKMTIEALEATLKRGSSQPPDGSFRGWNIADAHGLCLDQVFYPKHDDPEILMLPELLHDEYGRLVHQEIGWDGQADGSFRPVAVDADHVSTGK